MKDPLKYLNNNFRIFTLLIFMVLLLPDLLKEGIFMDGLIYSAIAGNMAGGEGSLWHPVFTSADGIFHDQPPLAFGLQSIFFSLSGKAFYIEKIYALLMAAFTAAIIAGIWRRISSRREMYWLPLLLWISIERVFWAFNNNMLENTMTVFSLAAVYLLLLSLSQESKKKFLSLAVAAALLFCSFLAKGLPGLYPLGFFACYFPAFRKTYGLKAALIDTAALISLFALISSLFLLCNDAAFQNIRQYLDGQVMNSIQSKDRVGLRMPFISGFFQQLLGVILFTAIVIAFNFKSFRDERMLLRGEKYWLLFLLLGLSAFLPLLISPKLSFYYLIPSFPLFVMFFCLLISNILFTQIKKLQRFGMFLVPFRVIVVAGALAVICISVFNYGSFCRDEALIGDVVKIGSKIPAGSKLGISGTVEQDWPFLAYLKRKFPVDVVKENEAAEYLLISKEEESRAAFQKTGTETNTYLLLSADFLKKGSSEK